MKKIAIVYGGDSCEHDVSIITAVTVRNMIKNDCDARLVYLRDGCFRTGKGLEKIGVYGNFDGKKFREVFFKNGKMFYIGKFGLKSEDIDCALVCCHGGEGENGSLSGYFEVADVPYTASGVFASALCMDKVFSKLLLAKLKFPVVPYSVFRRGGGAAEGVEALGYPVVVKPARQGSSVGISIAKNSEELRESIATALLYDDKILIETALQNFEEYNCAAAEIGGKIVVGEIERPTSLGEYLDFYDKYFSAAAGREFPAKIDKKLRDKIRKYTEEIYKSFELKGPVRVDFLRSEGKLYVNEINTIPGALACYLFKYGDIGGSELLEGSVDAAIAKHAESKKLRRNFASEILKNYVGGGKKGLKKSN